MKICADVHLLEKLLDVRARADFLRESVEDVEGEGRMLDLIILQHKENQQVNSSSCLRLSLTPAARSAPNTPANRIRAIMSKDLLNRQLLSLVLRLN